MFSIFLFLWVYVHIFQLVNFGKYVLYNSIYLFQFKCSLLFILIYFHIIICSLYSNFFLSVSMFSIALFLCLSTYIIHMFYKFCFENTVHTLIQYCISFLSISFFEHVCSLYSYYIFSLYSFVSTFSYISNYYFPSYFLILLFFLNLCFSRVL